MGTRLRTGSCFYSTCLSTELHPILPNLINSTPRSSVNFRLVDIFTKSCISSNNLINISYSKTYRISCFPSEVSTKERLWHFVIAQQYTAAKPDSFSNIQIRKLCRSQKYNILSQYGVIKFYKVLRLFYDFCAFISTLHYYSSWLSSSSNWRICTSTLTTCKWTGTVDRVYGRRILRWHNLTSNYTLSPAAEETPVRLVGQSS